MPQNDSNCSGAIYGYPIQGDDVRLSILDVYPDNPMGVIVLLHGFCSLHKVVAAAEYRP